MIYGEAIAEKLKEFNDGLHAICKNNSEYFATKAALRNGRIPDNLRYHYFCYFDGRVFRFGILENSDLELNIVVECTKLFNKIFNVKFK